MHSSPYIMTIPKLFDAIKTDLMTILISISLLIIVNLLLLKFSINKKRM